MKTKYSYLVVFILGLIFILPGILAYSFFIHPQWLPQSGINKGKLLHPVEKISLPTKKWQLILWSPETCQDACLKKIDSLARIRLALGRRLYNLDLFVLINENQKISQDLRKHFDESDIHVSSLPSSPGKSRYLMSEPRVFIANPSNYLILAYEFNAKEQDIFHDVQHLIRTTSERVSN